MTKSSSSKYWYGDLEESHLARHWTTDMSGNAARSPNSFATYGVLGRSLNHLLGQQQRVLWSHQNHPGTWDQSGSAPLHACRWFDSVDNARKYRVHVIALARESGSGDAYVNIDSTSGGNNQNTCSGSVSWPTDCYYFSFDVDRGDVTDAIYENLLNSYNGMTIHSISIQEIIPSPLDSDDSHIVVPNYPCVGGDPILSKTANDLRAALHECRSTYMGLAFSWSAVATAGAWSTPASTDETCIVTSDTTYRNIFDTAVTDRDATSPGWFCSARYMGVGDESTAAGKSVYITPYVYGRCTVDYSGFANPYTYGGITRFNGPAGGAVTESLCEITYQAAPAWFAGTPLAVNSTIADTATDATANKIDCRIMAVEHDDGGAVQNTMRIYAIVGVYTVL